MTPVQLAELHPRLFHVTAPCAWDSMCRHGLLPAADLVRLSALTAECGDALLGRRRPGEATLPLAAGGAVTLSDNRPLTDAALDACLDDGLRATDWYRMLNARVFFWTGEDRVDRLRQSRVNRGRGREVLAFDTLGLATACAERTEICPINSGSTLRRPTRRGLATFAPLLATDYDAWVRRRGLGAKDRIVEVVVKGGVSDIARYRVG